MGKTEPRTLPGFMELLPSEQILFDDMKQKIEKSYQKFGFLPIDTPIIEYAEVLLAKAGGETEKQIYRFEKGDTDLALRFDLTVPLAKYVAKNYGNLSFPFRRYQIGKVPLNNVSPENNNPSFSQYNEVEPFVCPGVCITLNSRLPT